MSEDIKEVMFALLYLKLKIQVFFQELEQQKAQIVAHSFKQETIFFWSANQLYARNYSVAVTVSLSI